MNTWTNDCRNCNQLNLAEQKLLHNIAVLILLYDSHTENLINFSFHRMEKAASSALNSCQEYEPCVIQEVSNGQSFLSLALCICQSVRQLQVRFLCTVQNYVRISAIRNNRAR